MRGVTDAYYQITDPAAFLLTRLMRGVTLESCSLQFFLHIFLLTRLMRGVTTRTDNHPALFVYFYSHASCEA